MAGRTGQRKCKKSEECQDYGVNARCNQIKSCKRSN